MIQVCSEIPRHVAIEDLHVPRFPHYPRSSENDGFSAAGLPGGGSTMILTVESYWLFSSSLIRLSHASRGTISILVRVVLSHKKVVEKRGATLSKIHYLFSC